MLVKNKKSSNCLLSLDRLREMAPAATIIALSHLNRPHAEALEKSGIRIVGLANDKKTENDKNEVWKSIQLINLYDQRRMRRIKESINIIFLGSVVKAGSYIRTGRICILNLSSLPHDWTASTRSIAIAGMIVHEATHGVLDEKRFPFFGNEKSRIELICNDEHCRVMEHLSPDLQGP